MNKYYFSSLTEQSFMLICLFLTLILSLFITLIIFGTRNDKKKKYINIVIFLVLLGLLCKLTDEFSQISERKKVITLIPMPMWMLWLVIAGVNIFFILELVVLYLEGNKSLDANSIKRAIDLLPEGICYFMPDGTLKLCNLQMYRLFYMFHQKELQHLDEFNETLKNCDNISDVVRLSDERNTYLFPDGKAWRCRQNEVTDQHNNTYTEVVFYDLTVQYQKNLELKKQTEKLKEISRELTQLSDNVSTMIREKEVLAAKTQLHNQMGAGLIVVRNNLMNRDMTETAEAIKMLRQVLNDIKNNNEDTSEEGEFTKFLQDAETMGVKVNCLGELPKCKEHIKVFVLAMRECLTNSVCHAEATELTIKMDDKDGVWSIQITNNGTVPESEVIPRGGLKNLKRHTLDCGGEIKIQSQPFFALTITIPMEKEKDG